MNKILIVDDSSVNRKVLRKILEKDYTIVEASSGKETLNILSSRNETFSAILLDIKMPEMDGFEVLSKIKKDPRFTDIPVIVQTESTESGAEAKALKFGAIDFVKKPYKADVILARLSNAIKTTTALNLRNAEVDHITGLDNINVFYFEGAKWIDSCQDDKFDIVACDIDNFSLINESTGIDGGNEILSAMALKIKTYMQNVKFLCSRIYADRFVFLFKRNNHFLNNLLTQANELSIEYSKNYNINFKFGVYEIEDKNEPLSVCCNRAFSAISIIKGSYGTKYIYYDDNFHKQVLFEEKVNEQMVKALEDEEFQVYLQPKYDLYTNSIAGAESLVRWIHPTEGIIAPSDFIPIFEKNGFICELDKYVWDKTASIISSWYHEKLKTIPVSVNVSRKDIERIDVVSTLEAIVEKHHISPELLHLEITESAYMQDADKIIEVVSNLKNKGFIIEMDDFGSGYSSLNMLAKLPIDILKLDMKFIQSIENSSNAKTIVEYTIGLAKWMNLPTVAEGVETSEQLKLLREFDCNYVQGFVFAKPMPEEDFKELLRSSIPNSNFEIEDSDILPKKYNMLIIEDLELNRAIIKGYFEDSFNIKEAEHGKDGIKHIDDSVDVIVLDMYMPEMDGFEILKYIREQGYEEKIPVLVISSLASEEDINHIYDLGGDAFVSKPFTAEGIISKVWALLRIYNRIEDVDIWDLKYIFNNPIFSKLFKKIYLIDKENENLCIISGESIVNTTDNIKDTDIYSYYKDYKNHKDKLYVISGTIKNHEYNLVFNKE